MMIQRQAVVLLQYCRVMSVAADVVTTCDLVIPLSSKVVK